MFDLTKQEKLVLVNLAAVFLIGTSLHYAAKKYPRLWHLVSVIKSEKIYRKININRASLSELEGIPYIGPAVAKRILDYREKSGGFRSLEELKSIKGVGDGHYLKIKNHLEISR